MRIARLILTSALVFTACGSQAPIVAPLAPTPTRAVPTAASLEPAEYLDDALDIIEANALNSENVTWAVVRTLAHEKAADATTPADTYDAIWFALDQLDDNHSLLIGASDASFLEGPAVVDETLLPRGEMVSDRVASLWLPGLLGAGAQATAYSRTAQDIIRDFDEAHRPCGWIVDLRENEGGNMWPMLIGVGPLLGDLRPDDEVGRFVDADGDAVSWFYDNGAARLESDGIVTLEGRAHTLQDPSVFVAVLTGRATASSGEAIAVAFRGRPNTRSFGQPTFGVSTGNANYELADGAVLLVTEVVFGDRAGEIYGDRMAPDELTNATESAVGQAQAWLAEVAGCAD